MVELKKRIKVPIYGGLIDIVFTDEDTPYKAAIRHFNYNNPDLKKGYLAVTLSNDYTGGKYNNLFPIIFSKNIKQGSIPHEALHVVNYIFKRAGIELDLDNDEPQAYLLGWIVDQIYKVQEEFQKKLESTKAIKEE